MDTRFQDVEGWLTDAEASFLYQLAQEAPMNGIALELGAYLGRSSVVIGGVRPVFCVDNFQTGGEGVGLQDQPFFEAWQKNVAGLPCFPLVGNSLDIAASATVPISFLYIDAGHNYEEVKKDIQAWVPKMNEDGIVAFHDYGDPGFPGVQNAVLEWQHKVRSIPIGQFGSIKAFRLKKAEPGKKLAVCISMASANAMFVPTLFCQSALELFSAPAMKKLKDNYGIESYRYVWHNAMPIDWNRNMVTREALKWGADYLLFLDVDQTFPKNMVAQMLEDMDNLDCSIVSGSYHKKAPPFGPVYGNLIVPKDDQSLVAPDPCLSPPAFKVDIVGMGCVLIKREVFEAITKLNEKEQKGTGERWFYYDVYEKTLEHSASEDVYFCKRAKKAGFDIIMNSTIDSGHICMQIIDRKVWEAHRGKVNQFVTAKKSAA